MDESFVTFLRGIWTPASPVNVLEQCPLLGQTIICLIQCDYTTPRLKLYKEFHLDTYGTIRFPYIIYPYIDEKCQRIAYLNKEKCLLIADLHDKRLIMRIHLTSSIHVEGYTMSSNLERLYVIDTDFSTHVLSANDSFRTATINPSLLTYLYKPILSPDNTKLLVIKEGKFSTVDVNTLVTQQLPFNEEDLQNFHFNPNGRNVVSLTCRNSWLFQLKIWDFDRITIIPTSFASVNGGFSRWIKTRGGWI